MKPVKEVRVLCATGMLGSGFADSSFERGLELLPDIIGCDAGSTDPGAAYLGSGRPHMTASMVERDMRVMLRGGNRLGVPVIIGTAGTAGADPQVEWLVEIVKKIASEDDLSFRMAIISAEQDKDVIVNKLAAGKITPLEPAPPFDETVIRRSEHIVGMMGAEPFIEALRQGAEVIIAGRSNDTAIFASLPLARGIPEGVAWHAAKILECGTGAAVNRLRPDSIFAWLREDHFVIRPLDDTMRCTPQSVASHALYENADPFLLTECSGVLDLTEARYSAVDNWSVKVEGSTFRPAESYTVKLEGAELVGYQSVFFGAVRDSIIINQIDEWLERLNAKFDERARQVFGPDAKDDYTLVVRVYGKNGVMGERETVTAPAHELCLIFEVTAKTQEMANTLAATVRHQGLHLPVPEWSGLITALAAPYSYLQRGAVYRFNMHHVVHVEDPLELFSINLVDVNSTHQQASIA